MESLHKELNILHKALSLGALIILGTFYFMGDTDRIIIDTELNLYTILGLLVLTFGIIVSTILFKSLRQILNMKDDRSRNPEWIKPKFVVSWALLEGAALINACFYFISDNAFHLILSLIAVGILFTRGPIRLLRNG